MNRLKDIRQEKKLSQKELAKKVNIPLRTYQRLENGETQIKPDKAQLLADEFDVSVGYLLGYTEDSKRYDDEEIDGFSYKRSQNYNKKRKEEAFKGIQDDFVQILRNNNIILSDDNIKTIINLIINLQFETDVVRKLVDIELALGKNGYLHKLGMEEYSLYFKNQESLERYIDFNENFFEEERANSSL